MPHIYRVEVSPRDGLIDGRFHIAVAHQLGIMGLTACQSYRLYFLQGDLAETDVQKLAEACLADPVTEQFIIRSDSQNQDSQFTLHTSQFIETTFLPGVIDPLAESLLQTAVLLGIKRLQQVVTGQRFLLNGDLDESDLARLAIEVFADPIMQQFAINEVIERPFGATKIAVEFIDLCEANVPVLAALIDYTGPDGERQMITGLFATYVRAVAAKLNKLPVGDSGLSDGVTACGRTAVWGGGWGARQSASGNYARGKTKYNQAFKETLLKLLGHIGSNTSRVLPRNVAFAAVSYCGFDPYKMAWAALDGVLRKLGAVGSNPEQVSIGAYYGCQDFDAPYRLGGLVRCLQGCYDAALAYETPFVWGQDAGELVNVTMNGRQSVAPETLQISAMGHESDVDWAVPMALKQAGDFLFVVGDTRAELGGSHFSLVGAIATEGNLNPPEPAFRPLLRLKALHKAIQAGLVQACHDCSAGGIAVAMAEMCVAGRVGVEVQLMRIPRDWHANYSADEVILFAESLTRFLVEVRPEDEAAFRQIMRDVPHECVGVVGGEMLRVNGRTGEPLLSATVVELEETWRGHVE